MRKKEGSGQNQSFGQESGFPDGKSGKAERDACLRPSNPQRDRTGGCTFTVVPDRSSYAFTQTRGAWTPPRASYDSITALGGLWPLPVTRSPVGMLRFITTSDGALQTGPANELAVGQREIGPAGVGRQRTVNARMATARRLWLGLVVKRQGRARTCDGVRLEP